MFRSILVATGGSPWSANAIDAAIDLASAPQQELLLVHILDEELQSGAQTSGSTDPQLRTYIEDAGQNILNEATQRIQQANLKCRTVSKWGSISEQIVHTAHAEQCDLIILGTRHLTGDKRLMTGRICNAVIATAPCPVLVVPFVQLGQGGWRN